MRILICEDEAPASKHLARLVREVKPASKIVGITETGEEALNLINQENPDLIFMDIELADGPCFETLDKVEITQPIVFTTAYDEYALKAFELNSIDYLVKPINKENIERAFEKLDSLRNKLLEEPLVIAKELFRKESYKTRFLVKLGQRLVPITTKDVSYFFVDDKLVWLMTTENRKYIVNYSLSELEDLLDPKHFFRLNRQYIVHHQAIRELEPYFKGQVVAKLHPKTDEQVVISRKQTPLLKEWMGN